jgi:hypothetical protein
LADRWRTDGYFVATAENINQAPRLEDQIMGEARRFKLTGIYPPRRNRQATRGMAGPQTRQTAD